MNRIERELAAKGTLNGRKWTVTRRTDAAGIEISELRSTGNGCNSYWPNHWTGKSERAAEFSLLDKAAGARRRGAALPRYFWEQRQTWFGRAKQDLIISRQKRLDAVTDFQMEVAA